MSPVYHRGAAWTRHAAQFVMWVRAWRAGFVPYDEVGPAIAGGEEHIVTNVPDQDGDVSLGVALTMLSRLRPDELRLVLPAPGDPRGLPGPGSFTRAALDAGEGVVAGLLGFVPMVREHVSGSGDTWNTVYWQIFPVPPSTGADIMPDEAESELSRELVEAVDALTRLDVARWQPELAGALTALRHPGGGAQLPAGYDPRARRLYARATMLDSVLNLAESSAPGGAVSASEVQRRAELLRPLRVACRRAMMAACNAPLG
jgi:hypothetical protein